ncbi:MAG: hypothetical protein NTY98_03185 [Verrucomicrobia bacterium]|nr:hypothetical protein [Verrucomicrobiota bacterium]
MSLPHTGIYIAECDGHQICFDGNKWWSDDWPYFNEWLADDFAEESAGETRTHRTVADIARRVLKSWFKDYKEIHFESDTWGPEDELPEGAID